MSPSVMSPRTTGPPPTYHPGQIAKATFGVVAVIGAVMIAASYPIAAIVTIGAAIIGRHIARDIVRYVQPRMEDPDAAQYCVPKVGICVTNPADGN